MTCRPRPHQAVSQGDVTARTREADSLLATIRELTAEWLGDDIDGFTLTAAGSLFGAWHYDDTCEPTDLRRIRYREDDLEDTQAGELREKLHRFTEVAADEHLSHTRNHWTLIHLDP